MKNDKLSIKVLRDISTLDFLRTPKVLIHSFLFLSNLQKPSHPMIILSVHHIYWSYNFFLIAITA